MISPFHDVRFESDVSVTSDPRGESRPFLFIHLKSHPSLFQCGILFELFYQVIQTFVLVHNRILSGRKRSIIFDFRISEYGKEIDQVVCGGESGDEARLCDYAWIMDTMCQCVKYEVPFHFKQTGANFKRGEQIYHIPRKDQQIQAAKAKIDYIPPERFRRLSVQENRPVDGFIGKELYENEEQRYPDLYQLSLPL